MTVEVETSERQTMDNKLNILYLNCFTCFMVGFLSQGWVTAVRWLFYTPASTTSSYWPGPSSTCSPPSARSCPGPAVQTAGTQVCQHLLSGLVCVVKLQLKHPVACCRSDVCGVRSETGSFELDCGRERHVTSEGVLGVSST